MEKRQVDRVQILAILVIGLLVLPYIVLIFKIEDWYLGDQQEVLQALKVTTVQAFFSAFFSIVIGFFGALGLTTLRLKTKRSLQVFFLLPNMFPVIFVILSSLNIIKPFPFGLWGIVLVHVIINIGLVSVVLAEVLENKISGMAELCLVEGASKLQIIFKGVLPLLKMDLALLFLFVFSMSFGSFSVPLMVGDTASTVLEVLIYEKIKIEGAWSQALGISALQSVILVGLAFFIFKQDSILDYRPRNLSALGFKPGLVLPLMVSLGILLSPLWGAREGFRQLMTLGVTLELMPKLIASSFVVALGVGAAVFALLLLIFYLGPPDKIQKFILGYVAPSTVLTGFAILLLGHINHPLLVYFRIIVGLSILIFPVVYKIKGYGQLKSLGSQIQTAQLLGAGRGLVFTKIVLPQSLPTIGLLSGLAAFWASGDFALSSIVAEHDVTLALLVQGLMSNYRLEVASFLIWPLIIIGIFCFTLFWSIGHVFSSQSTS